MLVPQILYTESVLELKSVITFKLRVLSEIPALVLFLASSAFGWHLTWGRRARDVPARVINPEDGFGVVMQHHFLSVGSPLRNIALYPTQESQEARYLQMGWSRSSSSDMNSFFHILPLKEKQRVNTLEMFDEYEGWHCKCNHYMLLCAFQGTCTALGSVLPMPHLLAQPEKFLEKELEVWPLDMKYGSTPITRYAHSSAQLCGGEILISSGFGCVSPRCPHMRLNDIQLLKPDRMGKWVSIAVPIHGTGPGKLMHHSTTFIPSMNSVLLYGGRTSPAQANGLCYLLQCDSDSAQCHIEPVHIDNTSEMPEPRWRHTATCIVNSGNDYVAVIGGCSSRTTALDDCFLLKTREWKFEKLDVRLPEGRHSHYAVAYKNSIIIIGGLDIVAEPVGSCLELSCTDDVWQLKELEFEMPLPSRYGVAGVLTEDLLWLLGGIQLYMTPGLLVVNLLHRTWMEYRLKRWYGFPVGGRTIAPLCPGPQSLLHGHTCHRFADSLIVIGGGSNYFSFGTSLNLTPFVIAVPFNTTTI